MSCDDLRPHLTLLRVGHCRAPEAATAIGASWRFTSFPAGVAVIRHPRRGTILFDSGYGAAFRQATQPFPERIYRWLTPVHLSTHETLPKQLAARGIGQPDLVVLSHLHADHVAGLFDLAQMPARVQTSSKAIDGLDVGRISSLRTGCPAGLRDRLRRLPLERTEDSAQVDLNAFGLGAFGVGYDLLADGSMIAVPLPGHGVGQFGLYLPTLSNGPAFLVADAAWSVAALRQNTPPPVSTLRRLGHAESYLRTFAALRDLHLSQPELRLVPSHCPESFPQEVDQ